MNEEKGTIYAHPENYDLEVLFENDKGSGYDFDITVVYRHVKTGVMYIGQDSGCSCPSPFENVYSLSDLIEVNGRNMNEFQTILREADISILDVIELLETARQAEEAKETPNERRSGIK